MTDQASKDDLFSGGSEEEKLYNDPGQDLLRYRVGTFETFVTNILDDLMRTDTSAGILASPPTEVLGEEGVSEQRRRIRFNLTDDDNWLLSLVRSWATVCDILTFYQERTLNEGYLRTAQQSLSQHELARMINYEPRPGVGGSLQAAFMASEVDRMPQKVQISPRTKLHGSSPAGDNMVFETAMPLLARAEWNQITPVEARETQPGVLRGDATWVDVLGPPGPLAPGTVIVVAWDDAEPAVRLLTTVEALEGGEARTRLHWREPLDADHRELQGVRFFALRVASWLFGAHAPPWSGLSMERRRRLRPIQGGVRLLVPPKPWEAVNEELPASPVRCLVFDHQGTLYAGTSGDGMWRWRPDDVWRSADRGLAQAEISTLAVDGRGAILAGTGDGDIYRSTDQGAIWTLITGKGVRAVSGWSLPRRRNRKILDRLPETAVRSLWVGGRGRVASIFAGTDTGIYMSSDLGSTWRPMNQGLPGVDEDTGETDLVIEALVSADDRRLYAATSAGVFRGDDQGGRWESISRGLPAADPISGISEEPVLALLVYRDRRLQKDYLVASLPSGLFRSEDGEGGWKRSHGLPSGEGNEVTSLAVLDDPITVTVQIFAGTAQGLWRSLDHGSSWEEVDLGPPPQVGALVASPKGGSLAVATELGGFDKEEWPHFYLSGGRIDLESVVSNVAEGGWVALVPDEGLETEAVNAAFPIDRVSAVRRRDFDMDANVTRLEVRADPRLGLYPIRNTRVFVQSYELTAVPRLMPPDPYLALTSVYAALKSMDGDREVIVTGVVVPERVRDNEGGEVSSNRDERAGEPTYVHFTTAGKLLARLADQVEAAVDKEGVGPLELPESGPTARSDIASEERLVMVDPRTLSVWGNTTAATEGSTIYDEILGHGDAAQALQSFRLRFPLAFERGSPPVSTLTVRVQGLPWEEVDDLMGSGPEDRAYKVELDHLGFATVIFGDGVRGARLPTGRDNVVATYRTGMSDQAIRPGTVTLISNPIGLSKVTNPIAGTPGAPPESRDEIWRRATEFQKSLGRIVALEDYENFAANYPGISKAKAERLAVPGGDLIHVTVAKKGEGVRPEEMHRGPSQLLEQLLDDMDRARSSFEPVRIQTFVPRFFIVQAKIRAHPSIEWEPLEMRILEALRNRFSFVRSRFRGVVRRGEVIRTIQSVEGVTAVDLDVLRTLEDLNVMFNLQDAATLEPGVVWEEIEGELRRHLRGRLTDGGTIDLPAAVAALDGVQSVDRGILARKLGKHLDAEMVRERLGSSLHLDRILDQEDQLVACGAAMAGEEIVPAEILLLDLTSRIDERLTTRLTRRTG